MAYGFESRSGYMFKKLNCKFRTGYDTTVTFDINQISIIASNVEKPAWNLVYLKGDGGSLSMINDEQRKEIEKQLQGNLELE